MRLGLIALLMAFASAAHADVASDFEPCWNVGALSTESLNLAVTVSVTIQEGGKPDSTSITFIRSSQGSEGAVRHAYETARRAILKCGMRGTGLSKGRYELEFSASKRSIRLIPPTEPITNKT